MFSSIIFGSSAGSEKNLLESTLNSKSAAKLSASLLEYSKNYGSGDPLFDGLIIAGGITFLVIIFGLIVLISGHRSSSYWPRLSALTNELERLKLKIDEVAKSAQTAISGKTSQFEYLKEELRMIREELESQRENTKIILDRVGQIAASYKINKVTPIKEDAAPRLEVSVTPHGKSQFFHMR